MSVVIIDYGSGNLRSAAKAFARAVGEAGLSGSVVVTRDPKDLATASHVVLPGVGAFADCFRGLASLPGMVEALEAAVIHDGRPFLGICVGMQMMATIGREHGDHPGLDWIAGEVTPLQPHDALKVPQMGWNALDVSATEHPFFVDVPSGAHAYFVHSYSFQAVDPGHVLATVDYGGPITAVIGRDNLLGTQFHPEKSQAVGLRLITNFLRWRP